MVLTKVVFVVVLLLSFSWTQQTKYYKLDQTLVFSSAAPIAADTFKIKFPYGDIDIQALQATVEGVLYKLYFSSRAYSMCIQAEGKGVIDQSSFPNVYLSLEMSATAVTINGNAMGFDTSRTQCTQSSYRTIETFTSHVAEIAVETSFADTITDALSVQTQLPLESCLMQESAGVCQTCVPHYQPVVTHCCKRKLTQRVSSMDRMTRRHVTIPSLMTQACRNVWEVRQDEHLGTDAFIGVGLIQPGPVTTVSFGAASWTIQFYFHLNPHRHDIEHSTTQGMPQFISDAATIKLFYQVEQTFNPAVNKVHMYFQHTSNGATVDSDKLEIRYGEWLFVTFEAHSTNQVYTLQVQKYGSVTLAGQSHISPTSILFRAQGYSMIPTYREFLVWDSAIADTPQISSHKCQFNQGTDFTPLVQFNLAFSRSLTTQDNVQIVDQRNFAQTVTIDFFSDFTFGRMLTEWGPVAPLNTNTVYSAAASSPTCVECIPNCALCSDVYECSTCSAGSLVAGLCLTNTISPTSGDACSTTFAFDVSELAAISKHINSELRLPQSTSQVSFSSAKIVYPDSSTQPIADISSFTIPNYYVVGQTSFLATIQLEITANGVTKQGDLTTISLTQPAKTPPNCMSCMPNCSVCSDVFVCQACSSGSLIGGLCITNTLSASSGSACSSAFSLDVSQFATINSHINTQLGVASSTQQIVFNYAKIVYPDNSAKVISDVSSFTVDNYYVVGQTSFSAMIKISFTVNGVSKEEDFASISMTQLAKTPPNCMSCMPNCSLCSDLYICEICSSGTLVAGLCLANNLSPSTGTACSTSFSFDTSEITAINAHINTQLGAASSTQQVSLSSAKIIYPDSSTRPVSDISSFTIPNYSAEELTSFSASLRLLLNVNGESKEGDLPAFTISQASKSPPNCMACMPNCSVCSDIYVCDTCSSSSLIGGLCIANTLSASSGSACSSAFSLDVSQFATINSHINTQLGMASSSQQVVFNYAKIVYPDNSDKLISDISSFTVQNYYVPGQTSFIATLQLSYTANGVSKTEDVTQLSITQPPKTPPNCMSCMPNCSVCSDLYVCETCSSTLVGGLCLSKVLSPLSGIANSTPFTFDSSEFSSINAHINSQLGSSAQQVSFSYAKLIYPDSSVVYILDTSSFLVPIYQVTGVTSFTVQIQLVFIVNRQSQHAFLSDINLLQDQYIPPNICGCRLTSECNTSTRECVCEAGYGGTHCTLTEAELAAQQTQVSTQVTQIESTLGTTTSNSEALTQLSLLTAQENAVTEQTATQTNNIVAQIAASATSEADLSELVQIQSNLLPKIETLTQQTAVLAQSIKDILDQVVSNSAKNSNSVQINSSNVVLNIQNFQFNSPLLPADSDPIKVSVPSGIQSLCNDTQVSKVFYKAPLYDRLAPSGFIQIPETLSLDLFSCDQKQSVQNLEENIVIQFPVDSTDLTTTEKVNDILNGRSPIEDVRCSFYSNQTNTISSEGCSLIEVTASSIKCGCNHMTDFMVFLKASQQVLSQANYNVFEALTELSFSNLHHNYGFYFAVGYWGAYLVLALIFELVCKKRKSSFYVKLFVKMKREDKIWVQEGNSEMEKRLSRLEEAFEKEFKVKPLEDTNKRDSTTYLSNQKNSEITTLSIKVQSQKGSQIQNQSSNLDNSFYSIGPSKRPQILLKSVKESTTENYISQSQKVKGRILKTLEHEKRCCCGFWKLFGNEITTNNQLYNSVRGVSFLILPSVRISLIMLAILLEFSLNALFYNLNPNEEDAPLFWEGIIENVWVAFFSFILAIVPLFLIGFTFSQSNQIKKKLRRAENPLQLKSIYQRLKRRLRVKTILGLVLFALVSSFLLLYIICFCHVANERMTDDWARSSGILLVVDLAVLELLPGVVFGILGLFYVQCKQNRTLLCVILTMELYRLYRNLIEV